MYYIFPKLYHDVYYYTKMNYFVQHVSYNVLHCTVIYCDVLYYTAMINNVQPV